MMKLSYLSFFFLFLALMSYTGCDDDADMRTPVDYNPNCCVYGTMQRDDVDQRWEVAVALESGAWDTIPGTRRPSTSFQLPLGVNRLNDFQGNRHLYTDLNGENLVVQDLTTYNTRQIPLLDPDSGSGIRGSLFLQQGRNNEEYFLYSGIEGRVYGIDLAAEAITVALDTFDLGMDQVNDFLYSPAKGYFVFIGQENVGFTDRFYLAATYDNSTKDFVSRDTFPQQLFGFVANPDLAKLYCLTFPADNFGYRLTEVDFLEGGGLSYTELSNSNLAIGQISEQLQTLHTATNSYLCYGETPPFKLIYQVDLSSGELRQQIVLEDFGTMIKLAGE